MRILLDECIDENLRHSFAGHECHTCRYAGLKGMANGELLAAAERAGYDVLITVDKNMPHQQNLHGRSISVIVLEGRSTSSDDLVILIPERSDGHKCPEARSRPPHRFPMTTIKTDSLADH